MSLEDVCRALENLEHEVTLEEDLRKKAYNAVKRMLEVV